jgi:hypothetical protein
MKISSNKKPNEFVSFYKIVDTIDSCVKEEHLKDSRKLIDLYFQMFKPICKNKFIDKKYKKLNDFLTLLWIEKYDELGIEFTI